MMFACSSSDGPTPIIDPVDGGPCNYDTLQFTARVTSIEPMSADEYSNTEVSDEKLTPYFHVQLSFNTSSLSVESQYLEDFVSPLIDSAFLARNGIGFGTELSGTILEITKGSCIPYTISFDKEFQ